MTDTGQHHTAGPSSAVRTFDMSPLDDSVGFMLKRGQIAFSRRMHEAFAQFDLTTVQFSALTVIAKNPGIGQGDLAVALEVERPRIVPVLDTLERRGLATRRPDSRDRRSRRIHLTDDGAELLGQVQRNFEELEARVSGALGPQLRADLIAALRLVAELP